MAIPETAAAAAKSLQSCPTLCNPIDSSLPGSSVHGIFQAKVLEWGAIAFSSVSLRKPQIQFFSLVICAGLLYFLRNGVDHPKNG